VCWDISGRPHHIVTSRRVMPALWTRYLMACVLDVLRRDSSSEYSKLGLVGNYLTMVASIAIRYDLRQFPKVKARTPQTAPGVQGPATHFHSRLLLVTVNRVHRKRGYTDCKILCSLGPRCAVTDPLAFVGDNGLPSPNVDRSA
jgi:hypothetical protein